ncbi:MAG TPA: hypothetical protein VFN97_17030 [Actinospica sp.]|nr:hypothetical protein [Actinospica sp.]
MGGVADQPVRLARAILRIGALAVACWGLLALGLAVLAGWLLPGYAAAVGVPAVLTFAAVPVWRFHRITPPASPTVALENADRSELALIVRQISAALGVPTPAAIELSPDCDAWLEPRAGGPVLVVGTPFLWWLRVSELRGLLAPVIAGLEAAHDPAVVRARRVVRRLDCAQREGCLPWPRCAVAWVAEGCRARAEGMERVIAAHASQRARIVEPAGRVYAHEQVGLVAAAWERLLTRLASPAWDAGYTPNALNAALVSALVELGERDRVGVGLADRLSERPGCDLLDEPGEVDRAVSAVVPLVYLGEGVKRALDWEDYTRLVAEPLLREAAAAAPDHPLVAKTRALLLAPAPSTTITPIPDAGDGELPAGLRAVLQCGLVDLDCASFAVDWLDGVVLRDRAGLTVPVDEIVHALVDYSDFTPLRDWLSYAARL